MDYPVLSFFFLDEYFIFLIQKLNYNMVCVSALKKKQKDVDNLWRAAKRLVKKENLINCFYNRAVNQFLQ